MSDQHDNIRRRKFESYHVSRVPAEAVARGESERAMRIRMMIQGLGETLVALTENGDASATDFFENLAESGGGFKIGSGDNENGIWAEITLVGDPTVGMQRLESLGGPVSHENYREEIERRLRERGIDPDILNPSPPLTDNDPPWASADTWKRFAGGIDPEELDA